LDKSSNEPEELIQENYYNTFKLLELAKNCKHLKVFVQLSTAYVNNIRSTIIKEKVYDPSPNKTKILNSIRRSPKEYFKNYIILNSLIEHKIVDMKLNFSVVIIRPTLICSSYKKPFPGWIDSLNPLTAAHYYIGLRSVKELHANPNISLDIIPVDICANVILLSAMYQANKKSIEVFHVASKRNNLIGRSLHHNIRHLIDMANIKPKVSLISNKQIYDAVFFLKRQLPILLYDLLGLINDNSDIKKKSKSMKKIADKASEVNAAFEYFANTEWIFDTSNTVELRNKLCKEDVEEFGIDVSNVNWQQYIFNNIYGLWKYFASKECDLPYQSGFENVLYCENRLKLSSKPFGNARFVLKAKESFDASSYKLRRIKVLNSKAVKEAIDKYMIQNNATHSKVNKLAEDYIQQIETRAKKWYSILTILITDKVLRQMFMRINTNLLGVYELKKIEGPFIFMPNHQSYIDSSIITCALMSYDIKSPFIIAAEEFSKIPIVRTIFRYTGAFFIKRGDTDVVYRVLFKEYVKEVLMEGNSLEFFIEGTRTRRGKLMRPKFGIIKTIMEAYLEERIKEAYIVPVSVSYERVLEAESFVQEFEGKAKELESFKRGLFALGTLLESFRSVYVNFGSPIKLSSYFKRSTPHNNSVVTMNAKNIPILGNEVLHRIADNIVIMPTGIVASIMLIKHQILLSELAEYFNIIRKHLIAKKVQIVRF